MIIETAWMLMIGLGATDPSPRATIHSEKSTCEMAASVINDQAAVAKSALHASCSEIEFLSIDGLKEEGRSENTQKSHHETRVHH